MGDAEVKIRAKIEFQFFKGLENYSLLWNCVVHGRQSTLAFSETTFSWEASPFS